MNANTHARAKAIFLDAINGPAAGRRAYVGEACHGDSDLRREVESLLAFHEDREQQTTTAAAPPSTRLIRRPPVASRGHGSSALAGHLVRRTAKRLQIVCVALIAATLVLWALVNALQGELLEEFTSPSEWLPPSTVLLASALMLLVTRSALAPTSLIRVALAYEVVVSAAIAATQYAGAFNGLSADTLTSDRVGLGYVAHWMLFFTVLVPSKPREALVALTLSGMAVPVTYLLQAANHHAPALDWMTFASIFVWPYAAAVLMSFVAARVVHQLGVDVTRAQELGSYRLEAPLGQGGMGEVWRASHHMLARPAAVKIIRQDTLGHDPTRAAELVARFEREAQVIASLESPHTVKLYDFGTTDEGMLYYAMELLDGIDLDALVRHAGPIGPARAIHILRQVCASLAEAHQRGLVHRDIKPANIFLCRRGLDHDVVKVLDFGLATVLQHVSTGPSLNGSAIAGTPDYMAPETTTGQTVDARADVYSLGCVAYWLLAGRRVFERQTVSDVLDAHRSSKPDSLMATSTTIHPDLAALVTACLAKQPDDRPSSAECVEHTLAALASDLPWSALDARRAWMAGLA